MSTYRNPAPPLLFLRHGAVVWPGGRQHLLQPAHAGGDGQDFPGQPAIALIAMLTQLGYAAGLLLLVPLGDVVERRWLIVGAVRADRPGLLLAATASGAISLMLASVLLGIGATAAQQIVPVAATLADPARRGAVVGSVMSGLLAGILLSCAPSARLVTAYGSWRAMFWLAVPWPCWGPADGQDDPARVAAHHSGVWPSAALASWAVAGGRLAPCHPDPGLLFASFSAFWTGAGLHLAEPGYGLGPMSPACSAPSGVGWWPPRWRTAGGQPGARPVVLGGPCWWRWPGSCSRPGSPWPGWRAGHPAGSRGTRAHWSPISSGSMASGPRRGGGSTPLFMTGHVSGRHPGVDSGHAGLAAGALGGVGSVGMGLALVACLGLAGRRPLQAAG